MRSIRLWVDDERLAAPGFNVRASTYEEAIGYLDTGRVVLMSLDHDLGTGKSGYDIAKWIEERAFLHLIPRIDWRIHGSDPGYASSMEQALRNADKFWSCGRAG